jgi:hypothetical protein
MPTPLSYEELGHYLSGQDPYSAAEAVSFADGFDDPSSGSSTVIAGDAAHPLNLYWDFRHRRPFWIGEPGRPHKPLKVENYKIAKAMVIPYTYTRGFNLVEGGLVKQQSGGKVDLVGGDRVEIKMVAHLLIGYVSLGPGVTAATGTAAPSASGSARTDKSGDSYDRLGRFIRAETPFGSAPRLTVDPEVPDETGLEIALTWLADFSAAADQIASSSDNEMDLSQEQQCHYWDFPKPHLPGTVPPPTTPTWMRNYQITKAIRATYEIDEPGSDGQPRPVKGTILIGYAGAGDH